MAEHKVSGGTMLLFIDPNGGTNYDTVVCLKSVGVSDSINPIDTSSWCGPGKLPGLLNISYSFDGYHIQDADAGKISGTDLRILLRNKTRIGWKLSPESPTGGDEIQTGTGFISDLSSTYSFDSVGSFNFTLQVFGIPNTLLIENKFQIRIDTIENEYQNLSLKFYSFSSQNFNINIDWDDGSPIEYFDNNTYYEINHAFTKFSENLITINFSDISKIDYLLIRSNYEDLFDFKSITEIIGLNNFTNLDIFSTQYVDFRNCIDFSQQINFINQIQYYRTTFNNINFANYNNTVVIYLYQSSYINDLNIDDCINLTNLSVIYGTGISYGFMDNNSKLIIVDIVNTPLSSTIVNYILNKLVEFGLNNGNCNLYSFSASNPPTGQGIIDKATLISRGWHVITD